MSRCCCQCKEPRHKHEDYGESCIICGKHRPPGGPTHWEDEHPHPEPRFTDEQQKRRGYALMFGLDFDMTFSCTPDFFREFVPCLRSHGHEAIVVTARPLEIYGKEDVEETVGDLCQIYYTDGMAKRRFMDALGIKVHIWIDDRPEGIIQDLGVR